MIIYSYMRVNFFLFFSGWGVTFPFFLLPVIVIFIAFLFVFFLRLVEGCSYLVLFPYYEVCHAFRVLVDLDDGYSEVIVDRTFDSSFFNFSFDFFSTQLAHPGIIFEVFGTILFDRSRCYPLQSKMLSLNFPWFDRGMDSVDSKLPLFSSSGYKIITEILSYIIS